MVDHLLGGLFGGQDHEEAPVRRQRASDFIQRYEQGPPHEGIGDDEVLHNYQTVAGRLSPQEYEDATAQSLGRLSHEERRALRRQLRQQHGGQIAADDDHDPRTMAREISQVRQQGSDDPLGGLLGGGGLGGMLGGMLEGGGSSTQGGSSSAGDLLGGPLGKAVLGGVAAYGMKQMMDSR